MICHVLPGLLYTGILYPSFIGCKLASKTISLFLIVMLIIKEAGICEVLSMPQELGFKYISN